MSLKPEVSISIGLAVGVLVFSIYQHALPSLVDHRVGERDDPDAAAALKTASWTAAGATAGISLLAKDPTVFVIGGGMVIAMNLWHRHANLVNPITGRATALTSAAPADVSPDMAYVGSE